MALFSLLAVLASAATPVTTAAPARSAVAYARVTARVVSAVAIVGDDSKSAPAAPQILTRTASDPANGQTLKLAEFQ